MLLGLGHAFPDFVLEGFSSAAERRTRPLLVLTWKTSCPTCRLTVPYFDRIQTRVPEASVIGVCQETRREVEAYVDQHGLTVRHLADAELLVSKRLRVEYVPTYYLTDATGTVLAEGTGWHRERIERIVALLCEAAGKPYEPLVSDADGMPAFKPG